MYPHRSLIYLAEKGRRSQAHLRRVRLCTTTSSCSFIFYSPPFHRTITPFFFFIYSHLLPLKSNLNHNKQPHNSVCKSNSLALQPWTRVEPTPLGTSPPLFYTLSVTLPPHPSPQFLPLFLFNLLSLQRPPTIHHHLKRLRLRLTTTCEKR